MAGSMPISLQGQFLIAMPGLNDEFFSKTLIYLVEHNVDGAMGLVLNKAMSVTVDEILEQVDENYALSLHDQNVLCGGPVEANRGFVLHRTQKNQHWHGENRLANGISVTASTDILTALINQQFKQEYLLILGYAGWQSGQLEKEIMRNDWWVSDISPEFVFSCATEKRLEHVLADMGICYEQLSMETGRV